MKNRVKGQSIATTLKIALYSCLVALTLAACGGGSSSGDTTAPTVSSTSPANNATGVAVNSVITATLSEAMSTTSITAATFTLSGGVTGIVTYDATNHIATFTPSTNLAYNTSYTATITTGAKDAAGNAIAANHLWTFTTGAAPDTTAPTVSSTSPASNATGVAINTSITATFGETMDASTITTATFTVATVTGTVTYTGTTATFTPSSNLAYNTTYTATITTGAKDAAGNAIAASYLWTFTTGAAPDTTAPTVSSTSPANSATGVATNTSYTATFDETMDASTITTATFGVAGVTGTVTYTGTTATFMPSSNLAYNTTYTATITTGAKDAAGNAIAANYIWTFTTGAAPDTTAPTTTVAPAVSVITGSSTKFSVTLNENGTGYYLVQPVADPAPSVAQVQAGTSFAMSANVAATPAISGLTNSTAYTIYFVARDAANNVQAAVQSVAVTTLAAGYVFQGGLTWMPVTSYKTWANADAYCTTTTINGLTGWRMPTQPELSALYASGTMNGQGWALGGTWTSTQSATAGVHAWVGLGTGAIIWDFDASSNYASCVR